MVDTDRPVCDLERSKDRLRNRTAVVDIIERRFTSKPPATGLRSCTEWEYRRA